MTPSTTSNLLSNGTKRRNSVRGWGAIVLVCVCVAISTIIYWMWVVDIMIFGKRDSGSDSDSDSIIHEAINLWKQYEDVLNNRDIEMNDTLLITTVKKLLIPPSNRPYNFSSKAFLTPGFNPSDGHVQAVEDILRGFGPNAFFIECGAYDGEWHSSSFWLEKTLGWKGLLIEADPTAFSKLVTKNRNAWSGHFCLSNSSYPSILPFYQDTKHGIENSLIKSEASMHPVKIQCVPLYTVLLAINRTTVDFFSLDVEGSELDVLRTVPFDEVIFKVITIEDMFLRQRNAGLIGFMERKGYTFYQGVTSRWNTDSIFIHSSVPLTAKQKLQIGAEINYNNL